MKKTHLSLFLSLSLSLPLPLPLSPSSPLPHHDIVSVGSRGEVEFDMVAAHVHSTEVADVARVGFSLRTYLLRKPQP